MRFILTNEGKIYDLESKKVSSWEYIDEKTAIDVYGCEEAFYFVYYYDEEEGPYLERDDKGGHSMDSFNESEIVRQVNTLNKLCDGFYIDEGEEFSFYRENIYEDFEEAKNVFMTDFDFTSTLYGFIKTSKGLIYIVKLTKDGDLELL